MRRKSLERKRRRADFACKELSPSAIRTLVSCGLISTLTMHELVKGGYRSADIPRITADFMFPQRGPIGFQQQGEGVSNE